MTSSKPQRFLDINPRLKLQDSGFINHSEWELGDKFCIDKSDYLLIRIDRPELANHEYLKSWDGAFQLYTDLHEYSYSYVFAELSGIGYPRIYTIDLSKTGIIRLDISMGS